MEITSIKYGNSEQTVVIVNNKQNVSYPSKNWIGEFIQKWLDAGNTIAPADPKPDLTVDERLDRTNEFFKAFLKAYAKKENLTPKQVRDAIKAEL